MKNSTRPAPQPIQTGRTRFADAIVTEFWMPRKPSRKAVILCDGCPSLPSRHKVGEFFARKGYWVFHPRYRGTWESDGVFLAQEPTEDVLLVAHGLNQGVTDLYTGTTYLLDISEIVVVGASFGGAAAILSTQDPIITKAVALSPVIDWKAEGKAEPFSYFVRLLQQGFGGAYRTHPSTLRKLQRGSFYSPIARVRKLDPARFFIVHAIDDEVVPVAPLRAFAKALSCRPLYLKEGGHFSTKTIMHRELWPLVSAFLKQ